MTLLHDQPPQPQNPLEPFYAPILKEIRALREELVEKDELARGLGMAQVLGLPIQAAYSVAQLAEHLDLDPGTIRNLHAKGELKGHILNGTKLIIYRWSVLEFLGLNPKLPSKTALRRGRRESPRDEKRAASAPGRG